MNLAAMQRTEVGTSGVRCVYGRSNLIGTAVSTYVAENVINRKLYRITGKFIKYGLVPIFSYIRLVIC
jgi:hypothetical protein